MSYETVRADLLDFETIGFLKKYKKDKKFILVFNDVNEIVKNLRES